LTVGVFVGVEDDFKVGTVVEKMDASSGLLGGAETYKATLRCVDKLLKAFVHRKETRYFSFRWTTKRDKAIS
jgi:hypothetical protein